ncbi:hypothetical protein [Chitinophaga sp. RAB17]|uniref:hypothetical protein n=1 Tax=Chitinophaga sp. RAB17 TaxID=3233049 RepID=UPI003F91B061
MKRLLFLCFSAMLIPCIISAQTNNAVQPPPGTPEKKSKGRNKPAKTQEIIIDYTTEDTVLYEDRMPYNSRVGLTIKNINKKLVDIGKNVAKKTFNEEMPKMFEIFSKTTIPDASQAAAGFSEGNLKTILFEDSDLQQVPLSPDRDKLIALQKRYAAVSAQLNERMGNLKLYKDIYYEIRFLLQYQVDLLQKQYVCNRKFTDLRNDVNNLTKNSFTDPRMALHASDKATLLANSNYEDNRFIIDRHANSLIAAELEKYNEIINLFAAGTMERLTKETVAVSEQISAVNILSKKVKNPFTAAISSTLQTQSDVDMLQQALKDLQYLYDKTDISKLHADVLGFSATGKKELLDTYDYFNESNFIYHIDTQTIKDDETIITVNVTPKENVPCSPYFRSYEVTIRPKGGVKIDFSTGLFVNLGGSDFMDQSYHYEDVDGQPTQSTIRKNKAKNAVFPSVGALMHIYRRNARDFHPALTFGVSTKDLEKINYHLGASLIFGYSQRFILSGGGTLTKAVLIADKYEVDQVVPRPASDATVPTSSFNRFGFFLAFTYNVSSK